MATSFIICNRKFMSLIYFLLVLGITAKEIDPPAKNINYTWGWRIGANWSTTSRKSDWSKSYAVVDCTKYGLRVSEFIEKYPYVTVQTSGRAISVETFGDVGKGKFGVLRFDSRNFDNSKYYDEHIVAAYLNHALFDVGVDIGLGFRNENNKLYLRPFTNGWIYSVGLTWRYLAFGLTVDSITFHPDEEINREKIFEVILQP